MKIGVYMKVKNTVKFRCENCNTKLAINKQWLLEDYIRCPICNHFNETNNITLIADETIEPNPCGMCNANLNKNRPFKSCRDCAKPRIVSNHERKIKRSNKKPVNYYYYNSKKSNQSNFYFWVVFWSVSVGLIITAMILLY